VLGVEKAWGGWGTVVGAAAVLILVGALDSLDLDLGVCLLDTVGVDVEVEEVEEYTVSPERRRDTGACSTLDFCRRNIVRSPPVSRLPLRTVCVMLGQMKKMTSRSSDQSDWADKESRQASCMERRAKWVQGMLDWYMDVSRGSGLGNLKMLGSLESASVKPRDAREGHVLTKEPESNTELVQRIRSD
jgi:hypothetical protein